MDFILAQDFFNMFRIFRTYQQFNARQPEMRTHSAAVVAPDETLDPIRFERRLRDVGIEVVNESSKNNEFRLAHDVPPLSRGNGVNARRFQRGA